MVPKCSVQSQILRLNCIQSGLKILRLNHIRFGPTKIGDHFTVRSQKSETEPKFFSPVQSGPKITVWSGQSIIFAIFTICSIIFTIRSIILTICSIIFAICSIVYVTFQVVNCQWPRAMASSQLRQPQGNYDSICKKTEELGSR